MTSSLQCIKPNAAGIDIGSKSHFVAVPQGRDEVSVKEFKFFTQDLYHLSDWLKKCKIDTIAMEATGSYWVPLYDVLEKNGFEIYLVNGRHVKNVAGRKSDVQDCQWLQQLHSYGLLKKSFIPDSITKQLRHLVRHRDNIVRSSARQIQIMQKTLVEMNMQLHNVISDISGDTGMAIIRAIIAGERDVKVLAEYRDTRCKNSKGVIEKSLEGNYKEESLFTLTHAMQTYDHYQMQIRECDVKIEEQMKKFSDKSHGKEVPKAKREYKKNKYNFDIQSTIWKSIGVNLMAIPGMNTRVAMTIISEIGPSVSDFRSAKHFVSWIGLAPNNKVSGGKKLSGRTVSTSNKIKEVIRTAVQGLERRESSLGRFLKRMKGRVGAPKAVTAVARKIAVLVYNIMSHKTVYDPEYGAEFEQQYKYKYEQRLKKQAKNLGFILVPIMCNEGLINATIT
jgi:transposase